MTESAGEAPPVVAGAGPTRRNTRTSLRRRLAAVVTVVLLLNLCGWAGAFAAFGSRPALIGIALLTYGLGLRHALDADHIAAIDNVTRKLMQDGQRPAAVGLFFALGHSGLVVLATAAIVSAASVLSVMARYQGLGSAIGTGVSAAFLLALAVMNAVTFGSIFRAWRRVKAGLPCREEELGLLPGGKGPVARVLGRLFRLVTQSWQMLPLGFALGLGFDTATEVALFSLSGTQAASGLPIGAVMIFPILFAAGMALVDTADGVLMLGAYQWAFVSPVRKLWYNMAITLLSVVTAGTVGAVELLGLLNRRLELGGPFWSGVEAAPARFNLLGMLAVAAFLSTWTLSWLLGRFRRQANADPR